MVMASSGCVSAVNSNGRTIFIADAHRDDGRRFIVRADEKLMAFLERLFWNLKPRLELIRKRLNPSASDVPSVIEFDCGRVT